MKRPAYFEQPLRRGLCMWAALLPLLLWQLPSAWHRCQRLVEAAKDVVQAAASPTVVVVAPEAFFVEASVKNDGLRTSVVATGFDVKGCIRYAGSSEAISASSQPLTVYLRSLPLPDCMGSHGP